ncbi:hypothetical protein HCA63_06450 [Listeria booriae]|uniref:hypothetical protein n=1 Tax=Listeria booriae TaxID=1552123 RepID=UPI0016246AC5|nr:hypothetical protein [Listeria booriae]MBC1887990.1 hypothetical protein [Listeria booriae]
MGNLFEGLLEEAVQSYDSFYQNLAAQRVANRILHTAKEGLSEVKIKTSYIEDWSLIDALVEEGFELTESEEGVTISWRQHSKLKIK